MITFFLASVFLLSLLSGIGYIFLIRHYISAWQQTPTFVPNTAICNNNNSFTHPHSYPSMAVIIPARNEAANIVSCLDSMLTLRYPASKLEIIVVDDFSEDETAALVEHYTQQLPNLCLLRLSDYVDYEERKRLNAYKKKALEIAISTTNATLIVTTDADCIVPPYWLCTLAQFYVQNDCYMLAAPVCFTKEQRFVEQFQSLDFLGMMLSTAAVLHSKTGSMCNGANFCYRRSVFLEVDGFAGIDELASGDDMMLMAKVMKKYPNKIHFVKSLEATVLTLAQPTLSGFINQRIRWASKAKVYKDKRITAQLAIAFLFNVSIVLIVLLLLLGVVPVIFTGVLLGQLLVKMYMDWHYLKTAAEFFGKQQLLKVFVPAQFAHILYIFFVGILGNIGIYTWKGRRVK